MISWSVRSPQPLWERSWWMPQDISRTLIHPLILMLLHAPVLLLFWRRRSTSRRVRVVAAWWCWAFPLPASPFPYLGSPFPLLFILYLSRLFIWTGRHLWFNWKDWIYRQCKSWARAALRSFLLALKEIINKLRIPSYGYLPPVV